MTGLTSRSRLAAAASPLALCLAFASSAAYAQDTTPPPPDPSAAIEAGQEVDAGALKEETPAESPIVVTGFRAALQNAVNTKKRADQIVESVSAEDIGKLPDASIAESISRLPGVASQRIAGSGRTSYLSIRGFAPDYSTTLLNGRPNEIVYPNSYTWSAISSLSPGQGLFGTVNAVAGTNAVVNIKTWFHSTVSNDANNYTCGVSGVSAALRVSGELVTVESAK